MTVAPALAPAFDGLAERLRARIEGRPIVFGILRGNWGDSLIRAGAEAFFAAHGFSVTPLSIQRAAKFPPDKLRRIARNGEAVLVANGGGGLSDAYRIGARLAKVAGAFHSLTILPSTVSTDLAAFDFPKGTEVVVREHRSARTHAPGAPFCHDMAFMLTPDRPRIDRDIGCFFRTDLERPGDAAPPEGNRDISAEGSEMRALPRFFRAIGRCRAVHTNRLHVGIAATLMGCETHLYPNSYFKNEAVFDASIRPHFPNAAFHAEMAGLPAAASPRMWWPWR